MSSLLKNVSNKYNKIVFHKNFRELITYNKAVLVSFVATIVDMSVMFLLSNKNTSLLTLKGEDISIGISSFAGLLIQFFGQKFWTFKNSSSSKKDLIKQVALFFSLEISIIICVVIIFNKISNNLESHIKQIPKNWRESKIGEILFEKSQNSQSQKTESKVELTRIGKLALKSGIVFLTFNLISYPLWRFLIFT